MIVDFGKILIENILLIKESDTESLHIDDFYIPTDKNYDINVIATHLIDNDFIETEQNDSIYYLTPECYEYIESNNLEIAIFNSLNIENLEEEEIDYYFDIIDGLEDYKEENNEYVDNDRFRYKRILNTLYVILSLFLLVIISEYYSKSQSQKNDKPVVINRKEFIEEIERITDSIKAVHNTGYK